MKEIKVFECDFCGKLLKTGWGMTRHKASCMKNPETVNCFRCENAGVCQDSYGFPDQAPYCKVNNRYLIQNSAIGCERFIRSSKAYESRDFTEGNMR
jgi:hypothetical protein